MAVHAPGELLENLWDPVAGRKVWDRLASVDQTALQALTSSPDRGRAILNFVTFSPISLAEIFRRPELLEWLSHADVQKPNAASHSNWRTAWSGDDLVVRDLRLFKSHE